MANERDGTRSRNGSTLYDGSAVHDGSEAYGGMPVVRTPRFPRGIVVGDLKQQSVLVQKETIVAWFFSTYRPAVGPYFAFADQFGSEEDNAASFIGVRLNGGPKLAGFGEGRWFDGLSAENELREFWAPFVAAETLADTSSLFGGTWERRRSPDAGSVETVEAARETLLARLDSLEGHIRALIPQHGGIGHNQPEESLPISAREGEDALRAIATMRAAVSSNASASTLGTLWGQVSAACAKIGRWCLEKVDMTLNAYLPAAAKAVGDKTPHLIVLGFAVWHDAVSVSDLVELVKAFLSR